MGQLSDRDTEPTLLATPSLESGEFEDFTERLLSAHRFCVGAVRKVVEVERWGRRGDPQDGIDFVGRFSDGATAAWQCKRYASLTPAQVRAAVHKCTFEADEYYLVCSVEASAAARAEMAKHPAWHLLDRRGLGRLLNDLPLHKRRDVLDETWGRETRKRFLDVPGEDAFLSLASFAVDRLNPDVVLNDCGPRVGRQSELDVLGSALDRDTKQPVVVLVSGPGGRGKTRLLLEALASYEQHHPEVPVLFASPGIHLDGFALSELPQTPAVVVVDDAHQHPEKLAPLLTYARAVTGTQLVFATRPSGVEAIRTQIALARFSRGQVCEVAVGELAKRDAKHLVETLTEGLGIPWTGREYFAQQAVHSPYVVVVAANLIRRGELTEPLAVDVGLRQQVLVRYGELALDGVDAPARRVLAVYAALGTVADDDPGLFDDLAEVCCLDRVMLLRVIQQLRDRGVLVSAHGGIHVTPDVLADHVLEQEAAAGSYDTGFTRKLWNVFGDRYPAQLVAELAELDWRLSHTGGPAVFTGVWQDVCAEILAADITGVTRALNRVSGLTQTQPQMLINLLEQIRSRYGAVDVESLEGRRIRYQLAKLYGGCATSAPELLESALDALWELRRTDPTPTNRYPDHPERIIVDKLADLGTLRHESYPLRILDRVESWLTDPAGDEKVASPLFVIRPLLAKDGHRTVQESRMTLGFSPYNIKPDWARPIRDRIRSILLDLAVGADLRKAGAAVRLLGEAIRPPQGGFNIHPTAEQVLAWDNDDQATIATLTEAAFSTDSPVIRRLIRQAIEWTAEHAQSVVVRHAALVLVTQLDEHGDDLAELVVGTIRAIGSHRSSPVPSVEDLRAADRAKAAETAGLDEQQRQQHQLQDLRRRRELRQVQVEALTDRALASITDASDVAQLVDDLDDLLRQARRAVPDHRATPLLFQRFAEVLPELTKTLVGEITAHAAGPLDEHLSFLLGRWAQHHKAAFLRWIHRFGDLRPAVKMAVADAYVSAGWAKHPGMFRNVYREGLCDPDPAVRERFLLASHPLLAAEPAAVARQLREAGADPVTTLGALEYASSYDGIAWGSSLGETDAAAVLDLIEYSGWTDYSLEEIVGGIAREHPELVLDRMAASGEAKHKLPENSLSIADAYDQHADILAQWLVVAAAHRPEAAFAVVSVTMCQGMSANQARHFGIVSSRLRPDDLAAFVAVLDALDTWPLHHPDLAESIIDAARLVDPGIGEKITQQIAIAMRPSYWGSVGGISERLNCARSAAVEALTRKGDSALCVNLQETLDWLDAEIKSLADRQNDLEDD